MYRFFAILILIFWLSMMVSAQTVTVSPDNVNVYSQGATSVCREFATCRSGLVRRNNFRNA
jgi:hypothetical protein